MTDAPPLSRRPAVEEAGPESRVARRRALPASVDTPPLALRRPLPEPAPFEPPIARRALPPGCFDVALRLEFHPQRAMGGGGSSGGISRRRKTDAPPLDPRFGDPIDGESHDLADGAGVFRAPATSPEPERAADFARAFARLRAEVEARDRRQASTIAALRAQLATATHTPAAVIGSPALLDADPPLSRVLWLAAIAGGGAAIATRKPFPTVLALALGMAVGHVIASPPRRVFVWTHSSGAGLPRATGLPGRALSTSSPLTLSVAEADRISAELGPGSERWEFDGVTWQPSPIGVTGKR